MIEKSALEMLQANANTELVIKHSLTATSKIPHVLIPEGYQLSSLEAAMPFRQHYRCNFETSSVIDYINYVELFNNDGATCFVSDTEMDAKTVIDLGDVEHPLHQKHTALLSLNKTAAFISMLRVDGAQMKQKDLSDWLEDWKDFITVQGIDGNPLTAMAAAAAVRKITIEATKKMESEVGDFSAHMSDLEKIEATRSMVMPALVLFQCKPYNDLEERVFTMRVGILTGGDKPVLVMRVLQLEAIKEEMTQEFKDLIIDSLNERGCVTKTFIGSI